MSENQSDIIARLNDAFRRSFTGGRVLMTQGVQALGDAAIANIIQQVQGFNTFTEDNDPHGEHDFGIIQYSDQSIYWKIDYYAKGSTSYGSENPADPAQTDRVLTILLAEEY